MYKVTGKWTDNGKGFWSGEFEDIEDALEWIKEVCVYPCEIKISKIEESNETNV